jgi:hypothetical protein
MCGVAQVLEWALLRLELSIYAGLEWAITAPLRDDMHTLSKRTGLSSLFGSSFLENLRVHLPPPLSCYLSG